MCLAGDAHVGGANKEREAHEGRVEKSNHLFFLRSKLVTLHVRHLARDDEAQALVCEETHYQNQRLVLCLLRHLDPFVFVLRSNSYCGLFAEHRGGTSVEQAMVFAMAHERPPCPQNFCQDAVQGEDNLCQQEDGHCAPDIVLNEPRLLQLPEGEDARKSAKVATHRRHGEEIILVGPECGTQDVDQQEGGSDEQEARDEFLLDADMHAEASGPR
mmetsp:Transcript_115246/g.325678  ORF Transcript_115246/g.325678 Transcript_115246/m.325678 type:complete len:215 (-) Transcript_115246:453-1097(-)